MDTTNFETDLTWEEIQELLEAPTPEPVPVIENLSLEDE